VNIKINDFVGNILQNKFYATSCYQVHALNADAHLSSRRCYATLGATGAETSLLLTAHYIE